MTQQEKHDIQLALDNEWSDRLFQYYKTFIKPEAIRSEYDDAQEWYALKLELKRLISEKLTKNETPSENPKVKSIKLK
jgi:hypothetical protein